MYRHQASGGTWQNQQRGRTPEIRKKTLHPKAHICVKDTETEIETHMRDQGGEQSARIDTGN